MTVFNRIVVALLFLIIAAGAVAVAVAAWSIPNDSIRGLRDAANWLDDHNTDGTKAIITAVAAGVGVFGLAFAVWEMWPKAPAEVKVTDLKIGGAVLSTAAVGQRVEEAVLQVPHVADARATVRSKRKGVLVSLDLHVDPEANLAAVTDEACQAATDVLTQRVHVSLAAPPTARLHYRELRLRGCQPLRMPDRRVMTPASPTPTEPLHAIAEPEPTEEETLALADAETQDATLDAEPQPVAAVDEGKRDD